MCSSTCRSSTSVPTSYSRLNDGHESSSRIVSKDRLEANDTNLLNYSRSSKTDNDVPANLERYVLKVESYKFRSDMPSRFLNTSSIESKYSLNRRYGGTTLELTKFTSSTKSPKTALNSRLQRKDSLTKSENADSSPSPIRSLERKSSSSAVGSSSPIEIRKNSEVWDKKLSVSYGENTTRGVFDSDLFHKSHAKLASRENSEDLSEDSIILENIENDEKGLTFAEIRKKFDNNDSNVLKGGFENCQKSSHSEDAKASISNGVILGVHNFGQMQYLDRNSKTKKVVDNSVDETDSEMNEIDQTETNFSSPRTLHGLILKPIPGNLKNNSPALRKSPDPNTDVSTNTKKRSSPDLKKNFSNLSPEKKDGTLTTLIKLAAIPTTENERESSSEKKLEPTVKNSVDAKRESKTKTISTKLGLDAKNDIKIQPKQKGERLLTKVEQALAKIPSELDPELINSLSRLRRSPETKSKDVENHTKVIELRRVEPSNNSAFELENRKIREDETKDKPKEKKNETSGVKTNEKSPQKNAKPSEKTTKASPTKEVNKSSTKDSEPNLSPKSTRKEVSPVIKSKRNASPKDEKESINTKERDLAKKIVEEPKEAKPSKGKLEPAANLAKETPIWDKSDYSTNLGNRTFPGPSSSQSSNSQTSSDSLVSFCFFVAYRFYETPRRLLSYVQKLSSFG